MLKKSMTEQLNEQINLEFFSSNMYLQMSAWCNDKGYPGAAAFLRAHAQEELSHMHRLFSYVAETGSMPLLGTIKAPPIKFTSLTDVFRQTYDHEKLITSKINDLADAAMSTKDYSTFNFLQWYVSEQHEEETTFKSILDKIQLIGDDKKTLFFIDRELQIMAKTVAV